MKKAEIFIHKTFLKIHKPMEMSQRLISEYLPPSTKTIIEYDCMPEFANILTATIVDMDENRVAKSFGIKQGIGEENIFRVIIIDYNL